MSRPPYCASVYPPSASGPYSDGSTPGWSGALRCVLSDGHEGDRHWNSGINWTEGQSASFSSQDAGYVCDLLRHSKTDPDLWTRQERRAVSRLFALAGGGDCLPAPDGER